MTHSTPTIGDLFALRIDGGTQRIAVGGNGGQPGRLVAGERRQT